MSVFIPTLVTVKIDHPKLKRFCVTLNSKAKPVKVSMAKNLGPQNLCYFNVYEKMQNYGDRAIYGWQIFIWPKRFMEAIHHAVWESPEGELIDLTQKYKADTVKEHSIFVRDSSVQIDLYKPMLIPSKFFILKKQPEVIKFIEASKKRNRIDKKIADLFYEHGYRNQNEFARAKGIKPDPKDSRFPRTIEHGLNPLKKELAHYNHQMAAMIAAMRNLDQSDLAKKSNSRVGTI